ncbi:MAG: hypothetical protein HQ549_00865 [Candidatus Omnitrophica bacterium]|nr:hypothetical protein [Candidatus Omnitrophota bacterium]
MKMHKFSLILIIVFIVIAMVVSLYAGRHFFLNKLRNFLIEKLETSARHGITVENVSFMPLKGVRLAGVSFYKDKLYKEKVFYVSHLYIKFPLWKFLWNKVFSPTIAVENLKLQNTLVNGYLGFSVDLAKKNRTQDETPFAIQNMWFHNLSVKNEFLRIRNAKGSVYVSPESIKTTDVSFNLNNEPCKLQLEIVDPAGEASVALTIASAKINLTSSVNKEAGVYKISKIAGDFFDSSFEFMGEFEYEKAPTLTLYGKVILDAGDIVHFVPEEMQKTLVALNPGGILSNSIYFKGNLQESSGWELGVKSDAETLWIGGLALPRFNVDARIKDGKVTVPLLSAYPYDGALASAFEIDLKDDYAPYRLSCKLSKIDIRALLEDTKIKSKSIKGFLFSEFAVGGSVKNINSMEGSGNIFIKNANLGPMPLLTPLLGNIYGYMQGLIPELKKVEITQGSTDFYIKDGRVLTDNLVLWGETVSIHAKGYIDFNGNLDFDVENKVAEPENIKDLEDWQAGLQEAIVQFGKMMSSARLTGTLQKPKWKFEYLGGIQNVLGGGLNKVLKGIFE